MTTVTGYTAEKMDEIVNSTIAGGTVVGDDLILTTYDGTDINVGNVRGDTGDTGPTGPAAGCLARGNVSSGGAGYIEVDSSVDTVLSEAFTLTEPRFIELTANVRAKQVTNTASPAQAYLDTTGDLVIANHHLVYDAMAINELIMRSMSITLEFPAGDFVLRLRGSTPNGGLRFEGTQTQIAVIDQGPV